MGLSEEFIAELKRYSEKVDKRIGKYCIIRDNITSKIIGYGKINNILGSWEDGSSWIIEAETDLDKPNIYRIREEDIYDDLELVKIMAIL